MAVLYQVEQQGRQTAFVGEDGTGLVGLYPLLARAAAITENENMLTSRSWRSPSSAATMGRL